MLLCVLNFTNLYSPRTFDNVMPHKSINYVNFIYE